MNDFKRILKGDVTRFMKRKNKKKLTAKLTLVSMVLPFAILNLFPNQNITKDYHISINVTVQ